MDPEGFFPLIVRGGRGVSGHIRRQHARAVRVPQVRSRGRRAGDLRARAARFGSVGAYRPLNDAEPFVVKQQMSRSDAESAAAVLRIGDRFWKFVCHNTNTGHFAAFRSEPAFMQVTVD